MDRYNYNNLDMTYPTATADKVPMEISCDGFLKSPLIFIPAMTPVRAGKNTPKTLNQFCLSVYPGLLLFFQTVAFQPWNPFSKFQKWYSILIDTSIQALIWLIWMISFHYFLPGSVWENDPMPKSTAPASKTTRSANCRRTTHC